MSEWEIVKVEGNVEDPWMTMPTEEQAKAWVENYNSNRQSPRKFIVREKKAS